MSEQKAELIEVEGLIIERLPNSEFLVKLKMTVNYTHIYRAKCVEIE
jgi:translation initiation factor IF-1